MKEVFVVSACRTAIGSFGGSLKGVSAVDLGVTVVKEALQRANVAPDQVDELMFGNVLSAGLGQNVARQVSVNAGIPITTPAHTVNMLCGSGMKTVIDAARSIKLGEADIVVTGGTENMTRAPYTLDTGRYGARMGATKMEDTMIHDGLTDAFNGYHMGTTAENVGEQWGITREEMDAFAAKSQNKAEAALNSDRFADEIVPVMVKVKREMVPFVKDEFPKAGVTAEGISKLRGAFPKGDGSKGECVTAANASGINDGASAVILASGEAVEKYGLKPLFKLISAGQAGVDPSIMGVGPIPASRIALERAGLTIKDIDLVEANEAFAAQSLAVARDLELDMEKVNVNGGAIALGHPIGASGSRIIVTLLHEMLKREDAKLGLATLCIGGGMGVATIFEKC